MPPPVRWRDLAAGRPRAYKRLDGQAPWTASLGLDQMGSGMPLTLGASLSPGDTSHLTENQRLDRSRRRVSEIYGNCPCG